MSKDYPIPAGFLERETEIKKSRFIARVYPVSDRDAVSYTHLTLPTNREV